MGNQMTQYIVYETTSRDPTKALKVRRPVAYYTDYSLLLAYWDQDILAGTHTFIKVQEDD
jgi:hypothetical protein